MSTFRASGAIYVSLDLLLSDTQTFLFKLLSLLRMFCPVCVKFSYLNVNECKFFLLYVCLDRTRLKPKCTKCISLVNCPISPNWLISFALNFLDSSRVILGTEKRRKIMDLCAYFFAKVQRKD